MPSIFEQHNFENAILVEGKALYLDNFVVDLANIKELTYADLEKEEDEIKQKYGIPQYAVIDKGNGKPSNIFNEVNQPIRSFSTRRDIKFDEIDLNLEEIVVKGSGFWDWNSKSMGVRQHPIRLNDTFAQFETHKYWGGQTLDYAELEYKNALILNTLIRKRKIPQATYMPIAVMHFGELPIAENGKIKVVSFSEYTNPKVPRLYTIPDYEDMTNLGQLIYTGKLPNLRVPLSFYKDENDEKIYTAELFHEKYSYEQADILTKQFGRNLAQLIKAVHEDNGTFTVEQQNKSGNNRVLSSLTPNNVSLTGLICDLDTLHFDTKKSNKLEENQLTDLHFVKHTIMSFSNLFEKKRETAKEGLNYKMNFYAYPEYGFAKESLEQFVKAYPKSEEIMDIGTDSSTYLMKKLRK